MNVMVLMMVLGSCLQEEGGDRSSLLLVDQALVLASGGDVQAGVELLQQDGSPESHLPYLRTAWERRFDLHENAGDRAEAERLRNEIRAIINLELRVRDSISATSGSDDLIERGWLFCQQGILLTFEDELELSRRRFIDAMELLEQPSPLARKYLGITQYCYARTWNSDAEKSLLESRKAAKILEPLVKLSEFESDMDLFAYYSDSLKRQGHCLERMGQLAQAREVIEQSVDVISDHVPTEYRYKAVLIAKSQSLLARILLRIGELEKARSIILEAQALAEKMRHPRGMGDCSSLLGDIEERRRKWSATEAFRRAAVEHYSNGNSPADKAPVRLELVKHARALAALGRKSEAYESLRKSLAMSDEKIHAGDEVFQLARLGLCCLDFDPANPQSMSSIKAVLEDCSKRFLPDSTIMEAIQLTYIDALLLAGDLTTARLECILQLRRLVRSSEINAWGFSDSELVHLGHAAECYRSRLLLTLENEKDLAEPYWWICASESIGTEALRLRSGLRKKTSPEGQRRLQSLVSEFQSLRAKGSASELKVHSDQVLRVERELARVVIGSGLVRPPLEPVFLDEIPQDAVIVHILRQSFVPTVMLIPASHSNADIYVALIVCRSESKAEVRLVSLGDAARIDAAIFRYRSLGSSEILGRGVKGAGKSHAPEGPVHALSNLLWDPIRPMIQRFRKVYVNAPNELCTVPWSGLYRKEDGQNKWMLSEHQISVTQGVGLLRDAFDAPPVDPQQLMYTRVLGVGGLRYQSKTEWPDLPGSGTEVAIAAREMKAEDPSTHVTMLTSGNATRDHLLPALEMSQLIHLATHFAKGGFDVETVSAADVTTTIGRNCFSIPRMVVSNGEIVSGHDIVLRDLSRAKLVVLSGCETTLGELAEGDGVMGLQKIFRIAGAECVIASCRQVPDDQTALLMQRFYRGLRQSPGDVVNVFQTSQLAMLQSEQDAEKAALWFGAWTIDGRL